MIEVGHLEPPAWQGADADRSLKKLLGVGYAERMRPSPLLQRLLRMSGEVERGEESLERKLRYLLWLN